MADQTTLGEMAFQHGERFAVNVLWTWLGVAANLFIGFVLSPYIIWKLGAEGYGLWALLFSVIGYYGILDLGFRPALIRYAAYFRARNEPARINEVINTLVAYYAVGSVVLVAVAVFLSRRVGQLFHISSMWQADFSSVVILTALIWVLGINVFGACVEAFQRFDLSISGSVSSSLSREWTNAPRGHSGSWFPRTPCIYLPCPSESDLRYGR